MKKNILKKICSAALAAALMVPGTGIAAYADTPEVDTPTQSGSVAVVKINEIESNDPETGCDQRNS